MKRLGVGLLAVGLVGCGGALPLGSSESAPVAVRSVNGLGALYPAEPGRYWVYATTSRADEGPERPQPDQRFSITEASASADGWRAVMKRWFGDRPMPPTLIERSGEAVVLSRWGQPELGSLTVLKWPLSAAPWPGRRWAQAAETVSITGTESVTVPAGSYLAVTTEHAIRYESGRVDRLRYWYVAGIGMVKAIESLTIDLGQGPSVQTATAQLKATGLARQAP